jgi:Integron cassette protein VCH_CASS1 chain
MALSISTLDLLNRYINGVMGRADHHGENVNQVVLTLVGAVIWKATQDVEVRTYNDETANILWLTVGSKRYAIGYNHNSENIELRERTQNGTVLAEFNNDSTAGDVKQIFSGL